MSEIHFAGQPIRTSKANPSSLGGGCLKSAAWPNPAVPVPRILTIVPDAKAYKSALRDRKSRAGTPIALLIFRETRAHRDQANLGDPSPGS